jgi:hypothetical protein
MLGWLAGGSLEVLGRRSVRWLWLVPLALAVEIVIVRGVGREVPPWVWPAHVAAYVALLTVVVANRRLPGMPALGLGLLLNATVIALNGGLMPQSPETLRVTHAGEEIAVGQHIPRSKDVVLPHQQARLWWLGDVITPPRGFAVPAVFSAGDLVVAAGLAWTVMGLMRRDHADREARKERTLWHSISRQPNS